MFEIKNLSLSVKETLVVKDLSICVGKGEIHAIMGPNGAGKSSLSKAVSGHPDINILSGEILLNGESVLDLLPNERASKGIFVSMQSPPEIMGLKMHKFLYQSYKSIKNLESSKEDFDLIVKEKMQEINFSENFLQRDINVGFSGGQKKKSEFLQMMLISPCLAIFDEIDSGLDIDSIKLIANIIKEYVNSGMSVILITHYIDFLKIFDISKIHIMLDGSIERSEGISIISQIEERGYESKT